MSSTNRVFVSPGVYTSEKDISYVTKQIGVTTLGLAGETTKGPAFQPIFVSNFNEFKSLCPNTEFHDLKTPVDIELAYKYATKEGGIHVLVEYPELYYIN